MSFGNKVVHKPWKKHAYHYEADSEGNLEDPCCCMCLRKYGNKRYLQNHMKIVHTTFQLHDFRVTNRFLVESAAAPNPCVSLMCIIQSSLGAAAPTILKDEDYIEYGHLCHDVSCYCQKSKLRSAAESIGIIVSNFEHVGSIGHDNCGCQTCEHALQVTCIIDKCNCCTRVTK